MAGGGGAPAGSISAEPNVIPMIDIMLVLLIIFMISQPLTRMAIDVQVPPPVTNQQAGPSTQIHAIFDPRPSKLLFMKPAPNRIYQEVIDAMDVARGAGVQVIGFTPKTG